MEDGDRRTVSILHKRKPVQRKHGADAAERAHPGGSKGNIGVSTQEGPDKRRWHKIRRGSRFVVSASGSLVSSTRDDMQF